LLAERDAADRKMLEFNAQAQSDTLSALERASARVDSQLQRDILNNKEREIKDLIQRTGAARDRPGHFTLTAPAFAESEKSLLQKREWTVLNGNFREEWTGREAKPSDPILRLGAKDGPWEIELKIPQKHIGQILKAYERLNVDELDVDFLVRSDPTRKFKGKLARHKIAGEANPNRDEKDEAEPVVLAFARISGPGIEPDDALSRELMLSGADVHAKVRCGDHRMGYALFYGVWEFLYEKVVFWF
jgi:hypothetical protein